MHLDQRITTNKKKYQNGTQENGHTHIRLRMINSLSHEYSPTFQVLIKR